MRPVARPGHTRASKEAAPKGRAADDMTIFRVTSGGPDEPLALHLASPGEGGRRWDLGSLSEEP
jgi:hypothetical protein